MTYRARGETVMPWWAWVAIPIVIVLIVIMVLDRKGVKVPNPNAADSLTGIGKLELKEIPVPRREMIQRLSLAEAITMNAVRFAASNEQDEASWERVVQGILEVLDIQGKATMNLKMHSREHKDGRLTTNMIRQQASNATSS